MPGSRHGWPCRTRQLCRTRPARNRRQIGDHEGAVAKSGAEKERSGNRGRSQLLSWPEPLMNLRHQWSGRLRGIPVAASGTLAWTLLLASPVCGQVVVQPYLGVYWFDDGALDADFQEAEFDVGPILGARVSVPIGRGWAVGGGYGLALLPLSIAVTTIEGNREVVELDAREHLYYGALEYGSWGQRPFGFVISAELGGATYSPESGGEY